MMNKKEKIDLFSSLLFPVLFISLIWIVKGIEIFLEISFVEYGIYPRKLSGFAGIFFSPLIHGDLQHLINNSMPMLLLSIGVFYYYRPIAFKVYFWIYFITGFWIWVAAREAYHIGASGLIYGFVSFIFFSGIIKKYPKLMALSLLVVFVYGGMAWGIFPVKNHISWEAHLLGGIAGLLLAFYFRKEGPQRKIYPWELENEAAENDEETDIEDTPIQYIYKPDKEEPHKDN